MTEMNSTTETAPPPRLLAPEEVSAALLRFFQACWEEPEARAVMERALQGVDAEQAAAATGQKTAGAGGVAGP